jgi:hypothetical protein
MPNTTRFVVAAWLAAAVGCSDDGLTVQDQNSSDTGSDTVPPGDSTGNGNPTTGESQGGSADGTGAEDTTNDVATGPASDGGTTSGTSDGPSSTSEATATEGSSTTEATATTEASSTGEVCDPITEDPSGIGAACRGPLDCLEGYTCQPFEGFVFQQTCQILCTMDCECPMGLTCMETVDKTGVPWFQCG